MLAGGPHGRLHGQPHDRLQHVGVVRGAAGAGLDHVGQRGGELARRQRPQRQARLVRPDRRGPRRPRRAAPGGPARRSGASRPRPCSPARRAAARRPARRRAAAARVAMNPAHSRSSRVVFPVPVVPITTWCERSRGYGMPASGRADGRPPGSWPRPRRCRSGTVSGTEPGAAIRARAVRTWCRHCRRSNAAGALGASPPVPVSMDVDPPGPGQAARDQAERDRRRRDGHRRLQVRPAAAWCHMASQAGYGAAATCGQ